MNEGAELALLAVLPLLYELLTEVDLVGVRMIKSLESGVRVDTVLSAAKTSIRVVVRALLWKIEELVRRPPKVERLVGVDAVIPVVVFRLVRAKLSLIPVEVEELG